MKSRIRFGLAAAALLAEVPGRATFFTTAVFAERNPELIERAVRAGHEIASHGVRHMGFESKDIAESRRRLEAVAGVPVVDTKVADSLIKTTAAVRMLGAQVIVTGISAPIARTLVQLGVDVSTMHTRARLQEGIELALEMSGKTIIDRAKVGP